MQSIAHLGANDNEYLQEIAAYRPGGCLACDGPRVHRYDSYWRYGRDRAQKVPILRFRCTESGCRQVFSVLPSYLVPGQSYPAAVEEVAVAAYAGGAAPLATVAAALGVGTTTVFRWVERACVSVKAWLVLLQQVLLLLEPEVGVTLRVREERRRVWHSRRIRKPGKVDQLLLLEQWPPWVQRLRHALAALSASLEPAWMGALSFWRLRANAFRQFVSTPQPGKAPSPRGW